MRLARAVQERILAHRAWSACFPSFISPVGQAISIEQIVASLPQQDPVNVHRAQALRDIWARCSRFSDLPRETLLHVVCLDDKVVTLLRDRDPEVLSSRC